jgi:hypothetical protein
MWYGHVVKRWLKATWRFVVHTAVHACKFVSGPHAAAALGFKRWTIATKLLGSGCGSHGLELHRIVCGDLAEMPGAWRVSLVRQCLRLLAVGSAQLKRVWSASRISLPQVHLGTPQTKRCQQLARVTFCMVSLVTGTLARFQGFAAGEQSAQGWHAV